MKEQIFKKGIAIESNTYYKATEERYDIYLEDCEPTENRTYFSYTIRSELIHRVAFLLKDLENVTLDFGGATLIFHGRIVPFILDGCKNIKIINCKVDYERPFYTQAHVLECAKDRMRIRIDEGFSYRVEDGYLFATSETWEKKLNCNDCLLWLFDRTGVKHYGIILALFGEEIFPNANPPMPIRQLHVAEDGDDLILTGDFPENWDANDGNNSLLITHEVRDKCTVTLLDCENISIENFIIIHGAALGIMAMHSRNLYFNNYSMYMNYEGNGRLVTNNADAIHTFNCSGDFVLRNSYMDGMLDDTVNVHNNYLLIEGIEGNTLACRFPGAGVDVHCPLFCAKDTIGVTRGRTLEKLAEYTILDVAVDEESRLRYLTLDRAPSEVRVGDVIENLTGQAEILIENCIFGTFRGTKRLQSRKKTVVRNCEFRNREVSLLFPGDTTYWFESGPVEDVLVENCRFFHTECAPRLDFRTEVEFTEKENYYHKNITIKDCYFDKGTVAALRHVKNFVFENNTSNGEIKLVAIDCTDVFCDDNAKLEKA